MKIKCGRKDEQTENETTRERRDHKQKLTHSRTHKQARAQHQNTRMAYSPPLKSHRSGIEAGDGRHEKEKIGK